VPVHDSATSQTLTAARHCVPELPAVCVQPPALHPSTVHGLPSSQLAQVEPAAPHAVPDSAASERQTPALRHPPQHEPAVQTPPAHARPSTTFACLQLLEPHESAVHGLLSSHGEQVPDCANK
jgi:hypothetical protein